MAKNRMVNTRFWDDTYISNLDPIEKLLFIYFLTNISTNISGIYEIPLKKVAVETGIDREMVEKIIKRFSEDGKIFYEKGWVCLKNFLKNQNYNSPKIQTAIKSELTLIPKDILEVFIGYGYGIDTLSHLTQLNLTKDYGSAEADELFYEEVNDDGEPVKKRKGLKHSTTENPFSFEEQMERLKKSPAKAHKIAHAYFKYKKFKLKNQDQWEPELARTLKVAKQLKGYSGKEIKNAFDYCQKEWKELWTLETVVKRIADANK